jgi:eukaryotic-like serine/threonine-protein kinase
MSLPNRTHPIRTHDGPSRATILPPGDPAPGARPFLVANRRRFDAVAQIGMGGVGQVLSANDLDIGRRVAIKRIRPDKRTESAFVRFVQEVRTVGKLDHPNIVPIHDVGCDEDGGYYFVMKYVDGETLHHVLRRLRCGDRETHRRWTFERRTELFVQVLHAVEFAHSRGVLHRDLKPANIMVGDHGEVQLLDWGIAKAIDRPSEAVDFVDAETHVVARSALETPHGAIVGTPRYMAPEQARGEPADVRSETFTLSLLFYELLSLRHPLDGVVGPLAALGADVPIENLRTMARHPHQAAVPHDLAWIAMDGLAMDPDLRYPTVAAMIERIRRRSDGHVQIQCPATLQKSLLFTLARWVDQHPTATTLALLAAALGLAGTVVVGASAGVGVVAGFALALLA